MFDGLNYITLYWLSGFGDPKYEIWEAKKATISRTRLPWNSASISPGPWKPPTKAMS